jgi:hypothetical protein
MEYISTRKAPPSTFDTNGVMLKMAGSICPS